SCRWSIRDGCWSLRVMTGRCSGRRSGGCRSRLAAEAGREDGGKMRIFISMKSVLFILMIVFAGSVVRGQRDTTALLGRWDITVHMAGRDVPSWLEVY